MSRRLPARTFVAVLCLVGSAVLAPLLAPPTAAFGEHAFASNRVAGAGDPTYPVYSGSTLAQSFQVGTSFLIESVTLRVQNDGSSVNPLVVSIHANDPVRHVPVMSSSLVSSSQVTPNGASAPVNWTFPFSPSARLAAGSTYWIVAENPAPQPPPSNGYAWVQSNADSYPGGSGYMLDPSSGVWTGLPYDLFFSTYGLEYASNVTVGMGANRTQAQPGDLVRFTVYFNNTGNQTAPTVWINDTLETGLANPSLGFPDLTPVSPASFPNLTFRNVANGAHSFTVTAQAAIGTPPGSLLTNTADLAFVNATGTVRVSGPASASVLVGVVQKQLYLGGTSVSTKLLTTTRPTSPSGTTSTLSPGAAQPLDFLLSPSLARPFRTTNVSASLWISIVKAPPQTLRLNLSLLDNTTVVASMYPTITVTTSGYHVIGFGFPGLDRTFGVGHRIRLQIWSFGGGGGSTDSLVLSYNSTATPSRLNLTTTSYISIDQFLLRNQDTNATIWSPQDSLATWANVSDPFGNSRIAGVWINVTSPTNQLVASGAMNVVATDPSSLPSWILFNYSLNPPLSTGRYRVDVVAMEDNGVVSRAEGYADVAVPSFSFQNVPSVHRARVGEGFAFTLYYNNSGTGPAENVWINDTLPAELTFVTSSIPYTSLSGATYTWALADVSVGDHALEIDVTVPGSSVSASWVENQATLAYADTSGHALPGLASNATVFLNGPELTLTVTSSPASGVHSNETVTYTIGIQNTGDAAAEIWLNDTMPATFGYGTDDAGLLGGTTTFAGNVVQFHFSNMPGSTSWSFHLTTQAGAALTRNASYVNAASLDYTSQSGYLMPPDAAQVSSTAVAPWIAEGNAAFLVNRTAPGETVAATIGFVNLGNEPASKAWVNVTLDSQMTVADADLPFVEDAAGVRFSLTDVPPGPQAIFLNLTVDNSTPDRSVLAILGTLDYQDGVGNSLPRVLLSPAYLSVESASLTLTVTPLSPDVEAAVPFPLRIDAHNGGSGPTADVWLNVTLPLALEYYNDSAPAPFSEMGNFFSWHWKKQMPGSFVFDLYLRPRNATANGTVAELPFHLEYLDDNLGPRPSVNLTVPVTIIAPNIVLTVRADRDKPLAAQSFVYTLRVQNTGMTLASQVEILDRVDPSLEVLTYESPVGATGSQNLTWAFVDLAPGASVSVNLTVRVRDGIQGGTVIPAVLEANYTNSEGMFLARIRSIPALVTVDTDLGPLAWVALGGLAAAIVVGLFVLRRPKAEIEEAFLVYRDGVLISHLSRTLLREKDEDVLSGMLTAVQEFVREAFQYGEHRELHQLDFGEYRILIERGKYVYLAIVYSGQESPQIRKKVRAVIDRIEDQFGSILERWDGDMEEVIGARDLIRDTLLGAANHNHNHNHGAKPPTSEP